MGPSGMFQLLSTPRAADGGQDLVGSGCKPEDYDAAGNRAINDFLATNDDLDSPCSATSSSSSSGGISFRNRKPEALSIDCGNGGDGDDNHPAVSSIRVGMVGRWN